MTTGATRRTLVVDGNNLLARSTYAAQGKRVVLSSHDGIPTAALHIFIGLLAKYVRQEKPDNMVVCWDGGRSTARTAMFAGYKAARLDKPAEEDAQRPFGQAKEFLTLAGIHHVERPGVEADDLIAAYWEGKHSAERVVILSADKDFFQLLDGWTEQVRPGTGLDERWTRTRFRTEVGCTPEQFRKVMALTGDASDNVPGIPGFGAKTAIKFLSRYDWDLDKMLAAGEAKLFDQGAAIRRNLALITLPSKAAGVGELHAPRFDPTSIISVAWPPLEDFLVRYDLAHIREQIVGDGLWH